jgi:chitin synthase
MAILTTYQHMCQTHILDQAAKLGVSAEEYSPTRLTTFGRNYLLFFWMLRIVGSRETSVRGLFAILTAFVVETSNHRLAPAKEGPPSAQIILFDQPGFQTRGPAGTSSMSLSGTQPLISAYTGGQNGFDEFCINFADEMLQSYVLRHTFENSIG